ARAARRRVAAVVRPVAAALPAAAVDAHAGRPAGPAVADEDVAEPVRVVRDEVRRRGLEGDVAAVRAQDRLGALAVADVAPRLAAAAGEADAGDLAGREVADEDVREPVRVAPDEVRGERLERDVAAVRADRGHRA